MSTLAVTSTPRTAPAALAAACPPRPTLRCGADTGGTFTDVVFDDGRVAKLLSTPTDPSRGGRRARARPVLLAHGTTVATNALLERRGASVALITNAGFADVIEIARQDRPSLYDIGVERPRPLVPRSRRLEVRGRLDATGREIEPVDPDAVPPLPEGTEAVAICLLHADLDGSHERSLATRVRARDHVDVTCSSEVSPEFREYERTVTTVVNAYLRPACRPYVRAVDRLADDVLVMTSAGGLVPAAEAAEVPAALLLSGPAAGARAGGLAAAGFPMPSPSTWVARAPTCASCSVGCPSPPRVGWRVASRSACLRSTSTPSVPAAARSLASTPAGRSSSGPRARVPIPAPRATAEVAARRPSPTPTWSSAASIPTRRSPTSAGSTATRPRAIDAAGVSAEGVVAVVDAAMEQAVRMVTVARGVDPAGLALVAFGGAGPLHACAIADALGMAAVVVPPRAGVLSAVGLLCSPRQRDLVRSWPPASHEGLDTALAELADRAAAAVGGRDAHVTTALDCRYAGQSHELTVAPFGRLPRGAPAPQRVGAATPRSRWWRSALAPDARPRSTWSSWAHPPWNDGPESGRR